MACGLLMPALLTRMSILPRRLFGFDGQRFHSGTIRHVGDHPFDFDIQTRADFSSGGFEFIRVAAGDEDIGPGFGEAACHGLAKTFAAASDECCFAGEIEEWGGHARGLAWLRDECDSKVAVSLRETS
jgi:hypothetical protein